MNHDPTKSSLSPDPLDDLLRNAEEYLPDNGFTARVITALPARHQQSWGRFGVLALALLAGASVLAWCLPATMTILGGVVQSGNWFHWQSLLFFAPILAALASLIGMLFALVAEEE